MNKAILLGRLTADPELRVMQDANQTAVTRFRLAVNRRKKDEADFISCVCFGKTAENIEKFFRKGSPILICGHIQTGSYKNKDGKTVYTTDVVADEFDFVQGKEPGGKPDSKPDSKPADDDFVSVPPTMEEDLPFN